jgi:hypothetical protein
MTVTCVTRTERRPATRRLRSACVVTGRPRRGRHLAAANFRPARWTDTCGPNHDRCTHRLSEWMEMGYVYQTGPDQPAATDEALEALWATGSPDPAERHRGAS